MSTGQASELSREIGTGSALAPDRPESELGVMEALPPSAGQSLVVGLPIRDGLAIRTWWIHVYDTCWYLWVSKPLQ